MARVIIVVPAYNEVARLDRRAFIEYSGDEAFCFVNDGSTDGTAEVLRSIAAARPGTEVVDLPRNGGKPEAVRHGILHALDLGAEYVGFWDADLATPLEEIARFRSRLDRDQRLQLVYGSRVRLVGRNINRKASRHYFGRIGATLISSALGFPIYDTQCGAKLFRSSTELRSVFSEPFMTRWIFDVEILARWRQMENAHRAAPLREVLYELPLETWRDVRGSKVSSVDYLRSLLDLLRIRLRYL